MPSLVSLASSLLSPEDPTSKQLLRPWRMQLAPHRNGTPSWCRTRVTCEFGLSNSHRLTSRGAQKFLVDLHAAARDTCHVPPIDPRQAPPSFRRFGASIGATPVPIGPAVQALGPEMLGHTHTLTNTIRPTFFADPPEEIFVHKNVLC